MSTRKCILTTGFEDGNLAFPGLAIGQLVSRSDPLRWFLFSLGILCMPGTYATVYYLKKGGK